MVKRKQSLLTKKEMVKLQEIKKQNPEINFYSAFKIVRGIK